jgi:FAD/FMN-containing dehydrogenase
VQYDAITLEAMRADKRWLDPQWRLNPGVLVDPA